jgi:hypothetical protein
MTKAWERRTTDIRIVPKPAAASSQATGELAVARGEQTPI